MKRLLGVLMAFLITLMTFAPAIAKEVTISETKRIKLLV